MSTLLFANNASSTLNGSVGPSATSITLAPGTGAKFPAPGAGQYFLATMIDAATGLLNEIVKVTAVSGDVATVVRAQEGTTALSWLTGDSFDNLNTAGSMAALAQQSQVQQQAGNYAADTGTLNAMVVTLNPVPASLASIVGAPVRVLVAFTNTSTTPTLNINGLGAKVVVQVTSAGAIPLPIGALSAGQIAQFVWDGTHVQYQPSGGSGSGSLYGQDTGGADDLTVTVSGAPGSLAGLAGQPIYVLVNHNNATTSPTLNVNGLGAVIIGGWNGQVVTANTLIGGTIAQFVYNTNGPYFEYVGNPAPATAAQVQDGIDDTNFMTSQSLAGAMFGSNSGVSSTVSGSLTIPNGTATPTIMKWGWYSSATGNGDHVNFPVAFPNGYSLSIAIGNTGSGIDVLANVQIPSKAYFQLWIGTLSGGAYTPSAGLDISWMAIGY